jgi:hypothetical protein
LYDDDNAKQSQAQGASGPILADFLEYVFEAELPHQAAARTIRNTRKMRSVGMQASKSLQPQFLKK